MKCTRCFQIHQRIIYKPVSIAQLFTNGAKISEAQGGNLAAGQGF